MGTELRVVVYEQLIRTWSNYVNEPPHEPFIVKHWSMPFDFASTSQQIWRECLPIFGRWPGVNAISISHVPMCMEVVNKQCGSLLDIFNQNEAELRIILDDRASGPYDLLPILNATSMHSDIITTFCHANEDISCDYFLMHFAEQYMQWSMEENMQVASIMISSSGKPENHALAARYWTMKIGITEVVALDWMNEAPYRMASLAFDFLIDLELLPNPPWKIELYCWDSQHQQFGQMLVKLPVDGWKLPGVDPSGEWHLVTKAMKKVASVLGVPELWHLLSD